MSLSISVVIPYYNSALLIGEALASVRSQTFQPLEVIIVDDGSRPDDAAVLDRAAKDCVVLHLAKNRGPSVARNVGIARAQGDWIAFLDADDLWDPRKLELQAAVVEANPECRAVHCGMVTVLPDGRRIVSAKGTVTLEDFLEFPCPIFPSAVLMRRDALLECGLFDPTMGVCHDLDLFLRFCVDKGTFYAVPESLVTRRIQPGSVSRNLASFWSDAARVYRDFRLVYPDQQKSRATLREVHTDMAVRAVYAHDFKLLWRMLRRASRPDTHMSVVLGHVAWRVLHNRVQSARGRRAEASAAEGKMPACDAG